MRGDCIPAYAAEISPGDLVIFHHLAYPDALVISTNSVTSINLSTSVNIVVTTAAVPLLLLAVDAVDCVEPELV